MKITLKKIVKRFGSTVIVKGVDLDIPSGEMFFLLGSSGCGKTTILRMLAGFYDPEEGDIFFGDRRVNGMEPHLRNTALVFQNYAVWPHMSVFENVAYGLRSRNVAEPDLTQRVTTALKQVKMDHLSDRKPSSLSGGQQQRVALARAIVVKPDLLLFDEPLCNLDAKLRLEMRDEIKKLHSETKITSVYVTHDQEEALSLADRIAVMDAGIIHQIGSPQEIYNHPVNPFVANFIGECNLYASDTPLGRLLGAPTGGQAGFRPEKVIAGSQHGLSLSGKVIYSSYLGSKNLVVLRTSEGQEVKAWLPDFHPEGSDLSLCVPPDQILKFE
ncbi:MAG: ABC transporter ATP-binding protein [Candidatus Methylacidiphilales bacterium]